MPLRIDTERAAQNARRRLTSCYLCGKPLPPQGPGRRKLVRAEHVIPRSILAQVTPKPSVNWSLILDVHPECDARCKAPRDQLAKIIGATTPRQWTKEELGLFQKQCSLAYHWVGGWEPAPVIDGADEVLYGAHLWARGCHAALYGESLAWPIYQWTACPAPNYRKDSADPHADMRDDNQLTHSILGPFGAAVRRDEADTVSLMGGD